MNNKQSTKLKYKQS